MPGEPWHFEYQHHHDRHGNDSRAQPTTKEADAVHIIRKGAGTDPDREYALVTGGRVVWISHAAYNVYKAAGYAAVGLPDADYDRIVHALGSPAG